MLQTKFTFFVTFILLIGFSRASVVKGMQADSVRAIRVYTLQQAIDTALANDLRLVALTAQIEGVSATGKINILKRNALIGYRGDLSYAPHFSRWGYDPASTNGGIVSAQVTAEKLLYDGGKSRLLGAENDLNVEQLRKQLELENADIIRSVTEAFIQVVRGRDEEELDSAVMSETVTLRDLVKRLEAGGALSQSDLLSAMSDVNRAQLQLAQASTDALIARYSLAIAMGKPTDTLITAQGSISQLADAAQNALPLADSAVRLQIAIADLDLKRAELEVQLSAADARPTVTLNGDAGLLTSFDNILLPPGDRAGFLGASVGISVNGPLFDWGINDLAVQQKTAEATNVRIQNLILKRALLSDLVRLRFTIRQLRSNLVLAKNSIDLAQKSYERTLSVYAGGRATLTEVLQSHKSYVDSRRTVLQILAEITTSNAQIARLNAH